MQAGNDHQCRQQAAADHDGGDTDAEDVTDTKQRRRQIEADRRLLDEGNRQADITRNGAQP